MNQRTDRLNGEVLRAVSEILPTVKDPRITGMISVLRAEVTPDLKYAKITLSVLGNDDKKELLKGLNSSKGFIRHALGQKINLRQLPELNFVVDDAIAEGSRICSIIDQLSKEQES